jgi:hypothetical protein
LILTMVIVIGFYVVDVYVFGFIDVLAHLHI